MFPGSRSRNCSSSSYYSLAKSSLIGSSTCKAYGNATGCYATNPAGGYTDGACFWESELTGGNGYNGLIGVFGSDTVTLTDSSPVLSWSGQVACSESLFSCTEKDEPCIIQHQTTNSCPPPPPPPATQCPVGNGTEAGFAPGPVSVTAQVFNSGLLGGSNSLSFCYLRPSINTDCSASPVNNGSKIIFGPAGLPPSIKSVSSLHSTDLIYQTFHGFLEFRSLSTGAVVPTFGSNTSAKINLQTSILWDTGAYGQSTVPARVFNQYFAYFQSSLKAARTRGVKIIPCPASSVTSLCGSNYYHNPNTSKPAANVCNLINLKSGSASEIAKAQSDLLSLFPSTINITFNGGAVAALPTAFIVNDCKGSGRMTTSAVAVCSFVQPAPAGQSYYWLANPWFTNRYTRFEFPTWPVPIPASGPSPIGKIYWSDPITDCDQIV